MAKVIFVLFCKLLLISCASNNRNTPIDISNPYPNMGILAYSDSFVYEFKSYDTNSSRLIIAFGGSGWGSTLGLYTNNEWRFTGTGPDIIQALRSDHTIIIPEKWDRVPGINYIDDLDARYLYTKENLVESYVSTIDAYINENEYSFIFLVGTSEGAALLPLIYENMSHKNLVRGMVSVAAGGLSIYESYLISLDREDISDFWRNAYTQSIEINENLEEYAESIETTPFGLVYRQIVSFLHYRPFDYFRYIDIPILFIHGVNDMNIAVESTRYVQENLPEKPFEFIYYEDMGHIPMNDSERTRFRNDIARWIRSIY
jgi:pimeloyl-ACP methyl ester carboxylesterase